MENTCVPKNCKLFTLLGGIPHECPNYMETWWTPGGGGQPKMVQDCAPKRTLIMIQELHNRLIGVQKTNEQQRNQSDRVMNFLDGLAEEMRLRLEAKGNVSVLPNI